MNDTDYVTPYMEALHDDNEMDARDFYRWVFPEGSLEEKGTVIVNEDGQREYSYQTEGYKYNAIVVEVTDKKKLVPKKRWDNESKEWIIPKVWDKEKEKWIDDPSQMKEKTVVYRYTVTDDLDVIDDLQRSKYFCLMSPLTYVGNNRSAENARECYAIVVDLDMIRIENGYPVGFRNLLEQMKLRPEESAFAVPPCSAICASGTGAHIWWILDRPVHMYPGYVDELQKLKRALTNRVWNSEVVDIASRKDVQQEGIFQGFRVVGTKTKIDTRARVFKMGEKVTLEDLNRYVKPSDRANIKEAGRGRMTWQQAQQLYPEWTEKVDRIRDLKNILSELRDESRAEEDPKKREKLLSDINDIKNEITELEKRKIWPVNRRVYEWWKDQIREGAAFGHRYWCIAMLAVFARKTSYYEGDSMIEIPDRKNPGQMKKKLKKGKNKMPVTYEELESDAFDLIPFMNGVSPENEFTEDDVMAALEYWNEGWTFYKREHIEYHSGISIPKNEKRKGDKQEYHLEDIRDSKEKMKKRGTPFRLDGKGHGKEGRPAKSSKQREKVMEFRIRYPNATPRECMEATGVCRNTVYKWWNETPSEEEKFEIEQRARIQYYDSMMKREG